MCLVSVGEKLVYGIILLGVIFFSIFPLTRVHCWLEKEFLNVQEKYKYLCTALFSIIAHYL